jgi:putative ABC transport system permease protein
VGSILLIGVANASGLILTRSLARGHELAVRASLGAGRGRIANLLLTESVLLSIAAAVVGLFIAHGVTTAFRLGVPESVSRQLLGWQQLGVDARAAGFGVAIALAAGIMCGLVPALGASRPDVARVLNQHGWGSTSARGRQRLARALVTAEVAIAVTLLLCAGLLTRSVLQLVDVEPGYRTADVATLTWAAPQAARDSESDLVRLHDDLVARAASAPGVAAAAAASSLPATRAGFAAVRAYEASDGIGAGRARWNAVSPGYFDVLDIPVRGRSFTAGDDARAPRVAIVSESLAARHWSDAAGALGRRMTAGEEEWTIVGVSRDVRNVADGDASTLAIYVPHAQAPTAGGALLLRLPVAAPSTERALRDEIWRADAAVALGSMQSLDDLVAELVADQRIIAHLVAAYAATALAITLISLHAVVAHMVVKRRREFGIRAALGAAPRRILLTAMQRALAAALVGTFIGTALATGMARVIVSLLHGITPLDPAIFAILPLLLAIVFGVAVYVPARAAAQVDPLAALRT